jgi:MFS family permease
VRRWARRRRESAAATRHRVFRSLNVPNYRIWFAGNAVSVIGTWMQRVAQDWLVLELTDSAVAVGIAVSLQFLPILFFGLWGGLLVDRLDRRRVVLFSQAVSAVLATVLAVVTIAGLVEVWMVYALALGLGLVTVVDVPARHTFITELVGPDDFVNAQSLNSTIHNVGRLVGPAVAGGLIATVGVGWAFAINAFSFIAVLISLTRIDPTKLRKAEVLPRARGQVKEGLAYVWHHPELRACMVLVAAVALFGQNFRVVLPLLARDSLGGGAEVYGYLTSAMGAGAVMGALFSAARERVTAWSMLMWAGIFSGVNLLLAGVPGLELALLLLVALGVANITFNTLARTLLQLNTEPSMQGRVISLHAMVFLGSTPIGAPLLGWICETWGPRTGLLVAGLAPAIAALVVLPELRRLRLIRKQSEREDQASSQAAGQAAGQPSESATDPA